ncbi:MAG: DUF2330 domain-containing protein [Myxococcales bacterium]|nr:DUF2330 domain-containing protein [Myxococcales bacterium]
MMRLGRALGIAITAFVVGRSAPARACMPAPPEHHWVRIAEEQAVITYDPATKVEHFLRRASFESDVADFGFIVPLPSRPTLKEADPSVFARLDELTRPKLVYKDRLSGIDPTPLVLATFLMRSAAVATAPGAVQVLDQVTVAGYDAAVLAADSGEALAEWLRAHGYANGPEVGAWVAPYVAKRWVFAAFRMAVPPADGGGPATPEKRIGSGTVDIAFTTDTPFYPYREPESMRAPGAKAPRSLAVFFLGPDRVGGTLGENGPWVGAPTYARRLDADVAGVPGASRGLFLSKFVDRSSPRPGTDEVFFRKLEVQSELVPDPIEITVARKVPMPIDVVLVFGGAALLVGRTVRRRRQGGDG